MATIPEDVAGPSWDTMEDQMDVNDQAIAGPSRDIAGPSRDTAGPSRDIAGPSRDIREDDEEDQTCSICMMPWCNPTSEHRLVSLNCGHLFGHSCIKNWLENECPECPTCKSDTDVSDIRFIHAKAVRRRNCTDCGMVRKEFRDYKDLKESCQKRVQDLQIEICDAILATTEEETLRKEEAANFEIERQQFLIQYAEARAELHRQSNLRLEALEELLHERAARVWDVLYFKDLATQRTPRPYQFTPEQ